MTCTTKDAARLNTLYRKHVGAGPVDVMRLRRVIQREVRAIKHAGVRATTGLLRELRSEAQEAGRIARRCGR